MIRLRRRRAKEPRLVAVDALAKVRYALYSLSRARSVLESAYRRTRDETLEATLAAYRDVEMILERAAIRLEIIVASGVYNRELLLASLRDLEGVAKASVPPPTSQILSEIIDDIVQLYTLVPETPAAAVEGQSQPSEQAEDILSAAEAEAKRRLGAASAGGES